MYKIVDKKRFIIFLSTVLTIILLFISIHFKGNKAYSTKYNYKGNYVQLKIKQGDTIWSIAIENMPKNYDVRKMVYDIKQLNNIDDAQIQPGDLIKIPINNYK